MIELRIDHALAVATLARAPVNAINDAWIDRLDAVIDEVERSPDISVLWVRSGLEIFCAGADLELMRGNFASPEGQGRMLQVAARMQQVFARLEALDSVTVAEIGGAALGGGFELALACDLRIAADTAKLGLPEARLGLLPGAGGTQRLARLCGDALARRLILGAEVVAGAQAVSLGLAHWAVPKAELEAFSRAQAERIAANPRPALAACKRCIAAARQPGAAGYALELSETQKLYASAETQRRVAAFLEARKR